MDLHACSRKLTGCSLPSPVNILTFSLIIIIGSMLSAIMPPLQSPDEMDHIRRAYMLSQGQIMMVTPEGEQSGGMVDTGLWEFYRAHYVYLLHDTSIKQSLDDKTAASAIRWSGTEIFKKIPGGGFYFPAIYTPSALGLKLGQVLDLSVDASYRLTKLCTLTAFALILIAAFNLFPANPLTLALLVLPMSIFQIASPTLDGVSTALSILAISAFLKITVDKKESSPWVFYTLVLACVIVASSRTHLLSLLLLVVAACFYTRNIKYVAVFVIALLLNLIWLYIAMTTSVDIAIQTGASLTCVMMIYITNPLAFFNVLFATLGDQTTYSYLGDQTILTSYVRQFIGVLGWRNVRFEPEVYALFANFIVLIGVCSVSIAKLKSEWVPRAILVIAGVTSVLMIFFALLVGWTPHPATVIKGVQGRYFLVPMIMFAYALSGGMSLTKGIPRKLALCLVLVLGTLSCSYTAALLIERFYMVSAL